MTRAVLVALLAVAAAIALSCAGKAPEPTPYQRHDARKNEISQLWMQIRQWRAEANIPGVEPSYGLIQSVRLTPMSRLRDELAQMCEQPAEPAPECNDTCGLAENICENAERICKIAGELGNDPWANEKCASAKASCKEAKETCCECESKRGDGGSGSDGGDSSTP